MVIAIIGGIACGKSYVLNFIKEQGYSVISADEIYHELISPGENLYNEIVKEWGDKIVTDGAIDTKKLGKIVFSDKKELDKLNKITHPAIVARIKERIHLSGFPIIFLEAPLLIESGYKDIADHIWTVDLPYELQQRRLMERDQISAEEAAKRIGSQIKRGERLKLAERVIDTSHSFEYTKNQVLNLFEELDDEINR